MQPLARRGQDEEAGGALGPRHPVPLTVLHQPLVRLVVTERRNPVKGEPTREGQAVRLADTCVYPVMHRDTYVIPLDTKGSIRCLCAVRRA